MRHRRHQCVDDHDRRRVAVAGDIATAVKLAVDAKIETILVEVDRVDQIEPALAAGATHLLLDNMDPATLRGAVTLIGDRAATEASGGINLETIRNNLTQVLLSSNTYPS